MTTKVTAIFALIKPYHANMNYFHFFFAVILKSYKNVFTKLKDCIIPIAEFDQNFASRFIKNETISFL